MKKRFTEQQLARLCESGQGLPPPSPPKPSSFRLPGSGGGSLRDQRAVGREVKWWRRLWVAT
jgi:hypothetical protein